MKAIAAVSGNGIIGVNGKIPWYNPEDFKWFKSQTLDCSLVMGRKTFIDMPGLLKRRETYVLTRDVETHWETYLRKDGDRVKALQKLLSHKVSFVSSMVDVPEDVWVCGGAEIYEMLLPQCSEFYVSFIPTVVDFEAEDDVAFLPDFFIF